MSTVYPIEWEPPAKTGHYRNLQRRDVATWEKWLDKYADDFEAVAYDVAVGGVEPEGEDLTQSQIDGWRYSTALKIDVLLRSATALYVVEVKPAATTAAIGAAISYPLVLAREEPDLVITSGAIICNHLPPDIEWLAEQLRIRTWTV